MSRQPGLIAPLTLGAGSAVLAFDVGVFSENLGWHDVPFRDRAAELLVGENAGVIGAALRARDLVSARERT